MTAKVAKIVTTTEVAAKITTTEITTQIAKTASGIPTCCCFIWLSSGLKGSAKLAIMEHFSLTTNKLVSRHAKHVLSNPTLGKEAFGCV